MVIFQFAMLVITRGSEGLFGNCIRINPEPAFGNLTDSGWRILDEYHAVIDRWKPLRNLFLKPLTKGWPILDWQPPSLLICGASWYVHLAIFSPLFWGKKPRRLQWWWKRKLQRLLNELSRSVEFVGPWSFWISFISSLPGKIQHGVYHIPT